MFIVLTIIISLSLLVFFHEFGHFIFGKIFKVKIDEFGFGYPPRLCGIVKINGRYRFFWGRNAPSSADEDRDTIYSLNWIPFGGFNKLKGEEAGSSLDRDSFSAKPWWQRTLIALGGPAMNVVLAMILLCLVFTFGSYQEITPDVLQRNLRIKDMGIRIIAINPGSPAEESGLKLNDQIIGIDGQTFLEIEQIQNYVKDKLNQTVNLQIKRKNAILTLNIRPKLAKDIFRDDSLTGVAIGIAMAKVGRVYYPFHLALWNGITKTFSLLEAILIGFYDFFKELIFRQKMIAEAVGVVGLANMTAQAAEVGIVYLMQFVAMVSLLLAITQLIPFPALDGGRMVFFFLEGIRGKPIRSSVENTINSVGFTLLIVLMIYITYKDLLRLGHQIGRQ